MLIWIELKSLDIIMGQKVGEFDINAWELWTKKGLASLEGRPYKFRPGGWLSTFTIWWSKVTMAKECNLLKDYFLIFFSYYLFEIHQGLHFHQWIYFNFFPCDDVWNSLEIIYPSRMGDLKPSNNRVKIWCLTLATPHEYTLILREVQKS